MVPGGTPIRQAHRTPRRKCRFFSRYPTGICIDPDFSYDRHLYISFFSSEVNVTEILLVRKGLLPYWFHVSKDCYTHVCKLYQRTIFATEYMERGAFQIGTFVLHNEKAFLIIHTLKIREILKT